MQKNDGCVCMDKRCNLKTMLIYVDLLTLSFQGQTGEMCEILGRDAFLNALADPSLRVRVLDQSPKTLDQTLAMVSRMEAYSGSAYDGDSAADKSTRRKVRAVNTASVGNEECRLKQLEDDLADQRRHVRQLRSDNDYWRSRAQAMVM